MRPRREAMMTTMLRELKPALGALDARHPVAKQATYLVSDSVLSVLAMFVFKQPNLFRFAQEYRQHPPFLESIQQLFDLSEIPSDSTIRRMLDAVPTSELQKLFSVVLRRAQRQKLLTTFRSPIDGRLLLAVDGSQGISSPTIHCDSCLVKRHRSVASTRDGELAEESPLITYSHQLLAAVLVHPKQKMVLPLAPEPMSGRDAAGVQDSELKAAHRWLAQFRRFHPKLAVVFLGDALYANGPMIQALTEQRMKFMLRVKPGRKHGEYAYLAPAGTAWQKGLIKPDRCYRRFSEEPFNQAHPELRVTVLQECDANGKVAEWITNRELTPEQVETAVLEARRRWAIENETFQTLKASQGPHLEHNHGHGNQYLANNFAVLMMLSFLMEQFAAQSCRWYQKALVGRTQQRRKSHYWAHQWGVMEIFVVHRWEALYEFLANPPMLPLPDT